MRIRRVQTQDREVNQLQNNVAEVVEPLSNQPLAYGNLIEGVSLAVGDNRVNHLLGENLTGWILTRIDGVASIYDKQGDNLTPNVNLILNSSAAVIVSLFVF